MVTRSAERGAAGPDRRSSVLETGGEMMVSVSGLQLMARARSCDAGSFLIASRGERA